MFSSPRNSWFTEAVQLVAANVLVLALCAALYFGLAAPIKSNNLDTESRRLELYKNLVNGDLEEVVSDLRLLATGDGIIDFLAGGSQADIGRAVRRAVFVSKDNLSYDQVRYIDETGQEVFRVNAGGVVVPQDQLQNKLGRPYFQKATALGPGQIFISTLDLNVENNHVEQPLKPMLRLAMPVFDATGRHRGIYIINYRAADILNQLRQFVPRRAQRLRMLNEQGYWLVGQTPDDEWGSQLPDHAAACMAITDPALWAQVLANEKGQAQYHGGFFTWDRIKPQGFAAGRAFTIVSEDKDIIIASVISSQEWADSLAQLRNTFCMVALLLSVLTTFMTRFFLSRRRARLERDRFFNISRDLLCLAGFDGRFKRVNPAWQTTLGYTTAEITSEPFLSFVHPDDRVKTAEEAKKLTLGGETLNFENRYRCKDGTYRWLLWSSRAMTDEKIIYASARDTTERRQIEEKLRLSEERLRLMIASLKDYAIFMLAPDGKVMSWNAGAERIKGYKADEIIGRNFSCFYPPERIAEKIPELELKVAAESGRMEDENWRLRKDGSRYWANVIISPMRNSEAELIGFVKVVRDATARKEADERIDKLNRELKMRADLLEAANKELESFSYSVSHDLRAPLRHIHGFVELLQKSPAFEGQDAAQRQMGVIAKAAREMGNLIDDLLAFSRTGRAEMRFVGINMQDLVSQCIQPLEIETQGRHVEWVVHPLPSAEGDPSLLRLVWANLLGNAVKYTRPREQARIEIGQLERPPAEGTPPEVVYYVRDNGVGFDMQYASKLFGVFQRLHRADDFEGTGIGLANVQRIVHRHGGKVWAEAQVGTGAAFYFSLPARTAQPTPTYVNGKN